MHKNYYAIIPANVRYDEELRPNAKLLYGEITALCNQEGYCWASNSYFAELYGVEVETISRWIANLKKKGYIRTVLVYKKGTKEIEQRRIYIHFDPIDYKVNTPCQNSQYPIDYLVKDNNTFNNTTNKYVGMYVEDDENLKMISKIYQDNLGTINSITAEQLIDISKEIESDLFKEAILIATDKGKYNFGYVKGILKQWIKNSIKTKEDLEAYRVRKNNERKKKEEKGAFNNGGKSIRENSRRIDYDKFSL